MRGYDIGFFESLVHPNPQTFWQKTVNLLANTVMAIGWICFLLALLPIFLMPVFWVAFIISWIMGWL